ncbi:MAG TPA: coproporphyrinogen III oxidase, partial [Woeseiaceae bacterium]|nr:coproporphyrinogen III oxidase [Woeseiaceae bacterium]
MKGGAPSSERVLEYLQSLKARIVGALEQIDGQQVFRHDPWRRGGGGGGESSVLIGGGVFEQAGIGFSHVHGREMPPSATRARPELSGAGFEAMGVSLVLHPLNPHVPTSHANLRFFTAAKEDADAAWWFGGGFDLTPYYPVHEDVLHWHRSARSACAGFGEGVYERYKRWCDEYFWLAHRKETRGIGGLFFDDLNEWGFERSFDFLRSVGDAFL